MTLFFTIGNLKEKCQAPKMLNSLKIYVNARMVFGCCWALLHTRIRSLSFMFLCNHQDKSWCSPRDLCLKETEHQSTTAQSPTTQSQELALVVFPLLEFQHRWLLDTLSVSFSFITLTCVPGICKALHL